MVLTAMPSVFHPADHVTKKIPIALSSFFQAFLLFHVQSKKYASYGFI